MKKLQVQGGYSTIITLIFVLGAITVLGFVVEAGRARNTVARLTGGSDLAARSGAIQFSKTIVEETEKEYDKLEKEVKKEVEDEGVYEVDTEEFNEEVKKRTEEKLQDKSADIKNRAKGTCSDRANQILQIHKIEREQIQCTESEVFVKAYVHYSPVLPNTGANGQKYVRESKHKIQVAF